MCVLYQPWKIHVIVDAISRLSVGCVAHVGDDKKDLLKEVHSG